MTTYYTVYQITNLVNGKIYIGKHKTDDLDDGYMGSGKLIRRAIEKYGVENFTKEILFSFDTEGEMNRVEAELVSEEFIASGVSYNLCPGGQGGWGYVNDNQMHGFADRDVAVRGAIRANEIRRSYFKEKLNDAAFKEKWRKKISDALKENPSNGFAGKKHSEETKEKLRKPKNVGDKNPQFGKMWITNGVENRMVMTDSSLPEGWQKGRLLALNTRTT